MRRPLVFAGICLLLFAGLVHGQSAGSATLTGTVQDPSGAAVPGAIVTIRNVETGQQRTIQSAISGEYAAPNLQPADYEAEFSAPGFATLVRKGVTLLVGQIGTVDANLQVASGQETVTVTSDVPVVEPDKSDVSSYVTEQEVHDLPINGRRWDSFALLAPGVTNDGDLGLVSYRGISGLYNNNMIDGADNNQAFFSEARGRTRISYAISAATVKEFQVGVSNYSAEFGRAAGGLVNAVTRSGSNTVHGEGFYYIFDSELNAFNPLTKARGLPKPEDQRQQFGGLVSGPLKRDKMFWLLSYDGQRRNFPAVVDASSTNFFTPPANPAPGFAAAAAYFQARRGLQARRGDQNIGLAKFDWNLSPRNTLSTTVNIMRWVSPNGVQIQPNITQDVTANGSDIVSDEYVINRLTSTISSTMLNEFRVQYGRDFNAQTPNAPGPSVTITNGIAVGMPNSLPRPKYPDEKQWQFVNNLSMVRGNHTVKFGGEVRRIHDDIVNLFQGGGVYSYTSLDSFALDCPNPKGWPISCGGAGTARNYSFFTQAFDVVGKLGAAEFTTFDYAVYAQDNVKLSRALTLSLGLRWELQTMPDAQNPIASLPATAKFNVDKNNFGPRIGIAWSPFASNRTVVRTGYGLYYGRTQNSHIDSALVENGARVTSFSFNPTTAGAPVFPNVFGLTPTGTAAGPDVRILSPDWVNPQIHQWEFGIEQEVLNGVGLELQYVGSRGLRMPFFRDVNVFPATDTMTYTIDCSPAPASPQCQGAPTVVTVPFFRGPSANRPNTQFGQIVLGESVGNSSYHALILGARKRGGRNLMFQGNFTWSKSMDTQQSTSPFFPGSLPQNPYNNRTEKALSVFDRPKRLVVSAIWTPTTVSSRLPAAGRVLLNGWQFGVILTAQDGPPINATVSGTFSGAAYPGGGGVMTSSPLGISGNARAPWLGRNTFRGQGIANVNFSLSREFKTSERTGLELTWEAFNLFNRMQVTGQNSRAFTTTGTTFRPDTSFLTVSTAGNTLYRERQLQFAARFRF